MDSTRFKRGKMLNSALVVALALVWAPAVAAATHRPAFASSSGPLANRWRRASGARSFHESSGEGGNRVPFAPRRGAALAMVSTDSAAPASSSDAAGKGGPGGELSWDSHSYIDSAPDTLVKGVEGNESMRRKFEAMCRVAQDKICDAISELDGGSDGFQEDNWVRESGGGGRSRVLCNGKVFEKAGCNLSVV